jgi:hypothetical protein
VLTRYTLLVPHSNEDRLLVATTGDRTSLPAVTRDDDSFWQNVDHVNGMVDVLLGLPATTRRCLVVDHNALAPCLRARCAELLACDVPAALEHGDFGPWQVLADGDRVTLLDWSDSAVACPLWSLASFLRELPQELAGARDRLVDAYLEPWEALVPRKCLRRAWELCAELSGLYGALVYHREVLPQIEVGWEMERMLPFFARQLLEPGERSV